MKRALVLGLSLLAAPAAVAQSPAPLPVSVYPGTVVRVAAQEAKSPKPDGRPAPPAPTVAPPVGDAYSPMTSAPAGPLQPLAGLLAMPLPTTPTVPAGGCASGACRPACGAPLFSTAACDGSGKSRPCLDRVVNWLTWHPGPSVLPVLTPTPYQSPLRDYFPCGPQKCASAPPCASNATGSRLSSATAGCAGGICKTRSASGVAPATPTGYAFVPVVIALPPACGNSGATIGGHCAKDRLMNLFSFGTCRSDVTTAGCGTGHAANCGNVAASYYYANPTGSQPVR